MTQRPLIGTSPNQVSTNGMLGDLAFQDSNGVYIETIRGAVNLDKLDKEITDTAVDIFVYDTRKDSDGGAWRKRTQHTSWYNEALNTATRGSRREFPAVAVLVLTSTSLTIYDGDDPDLPMWMVFTLAANYLIRAPFASSFYILNAKLVVGDNNNYSGSTIDFIMDGRDAVRDLRQIGWGGNIADRNTDKQTTFGSTLLVGTYAKDVAMTVLPSAPIDPATGLPIPTIAVATDGGTSIIKDNGTVVDMYVSGESDICLGINFTDLNNLAIRLYTGWVFYYTIPSADITTTYWNGLSGYLGRWTDTQRDWGSGNNGIPINVGASGITELLEDKAVGHTNGLDILYTDLSSFGNGMHAGISTDFNTGWMHGDIKGAFLSDTDDTNVTGTGWFTTTPSSAGTNVQISGNQLQTTAAVSSAIVGSFRTNPVNLDTTLQYVVTSTATVNSGSVRIYFGDNLVHTHTSSGTLTSIAKYTTGGAYLTAWGYSSFTGSIELDAVRYVDKDRSVNNNGLGIYGTITKSAVATGAELVAYSGFSGNNVLVQPYNSSLDPGTGNYSFMCWFKCSSTGAEQMLMRRFGVPTVTGGMMMRVVATSSVLQWYVRDTSSSATTVQSPSAVDDGVWHCAVGTRQGSIAQLYLDGVLITTQSCSANSHDPGTTADLVIGAEESGANPGTYQNPADLCSLALVRYSLSAPSAEQIKKIYEDEKVLFQENAACTLYGSSDAVTALAYDEDLQLLHVGTSSGRSDFQGLRRINNTTTAVTTAISASNGLVAEQ
jgi:hypothetical protein